MYYKTPLLGQETKMNTKRSNWESAEEFAKAFWDWSREPENPEAWKVWDRIFEDSTSWEKRKGLLMLAGKIRAQAIDEHRKSLCECGKEEARFCEECSLEFARDVLSENPWEI